MPMPQSVKKTLELLLDKTASTYVQTAKELPINNDARLALDMSMYILVKVEDEKPVYILVMHIGDSVIMDRFYDYDDCMKMLAEHFANVASFHLDDLDKTTLDELLKARDEILDKRDKETGD